MFVQELSPKILYSLINSEIFENFYDQETGLQKLENNIQNLQLFDSDSNESNFYEKIYNFKFIVYK